MYDLASWELLIVARRMRAIRAPPSFHRPRQRWRQIVDLAAISSDGFAQPADLKQSLGEPCFEPGLSRRRFGVFLSQFAQLGFDALRDLAHGANDVEQLRLDFDDPLL